MKKKSRKKVKRTAAKRTRYRKAKEETPSTGIGLGLRPPKKDATGKPKAKKATSTAKAPAKQTKATSGNGSRKSPLKVPEKQEPEKVSTPVDSRQLELTPQKPSSGDYFKITTHPDWPKGLKVRYAGLKLCVTGYDIPILHENEIFTTSGKVLETEEGKIWVCITNGKVGLQTLPEKLKVIGGRR